MFSKTIYALKIIQYSFYRMIKDPIIIGLIGIGTLLLSTFLSIFFLIQHFYFGLSVVNFMTFMGFLSFPITTHFLQTLFCIFSLIVAAFIFIIFSYFFTYLMICNDLQEKCSLKVVVEGMKKAFLEIIRHSVIMTCGYFKWIFSLLCIDRRFQDLQDMCDKSLPVDEDKYQNSFSFFLYPLLVKNPEITLKVARDESADLIKKKFGADVTAAYSFKLLDYLAFLIIVSTMYVLYHFKIIRPEPAFLTALTLLVIYFSIIRVIVLTFVVSVYHYCENKNTILYPAALVKSAFVSPNKK